MWARGNKPATVRNRYASLYQFYNLGGRGRRAQGPPGAPDRGIPRAAAGAAGPTVVRNALDDAHVSGAGGQRAVARRDADQRTAAPRRSRSSPELSICRELMKEGPSDELWRSRIVTLPGACVGGLAAALGWRHHAVARRGLRAGTGRRG